MKTVQECKDEYYKPVVVNDFDHLGYFLYAYQSDAGTWALRDQDEAARLHGGETVEVLWPDGHKSRHLVIEEEFVKLRSGRLYPVTTTKLFIATIVHTVAVLVPIEAMWVKKIPQSARVSDGRQQDRH